MIPIPVSHAEQRIREEADRLSHAVKAISHGPPKSLAMQDFERREARLFPNEAARQLAVMNARIRQAFHKN